MDDFLGNTQYGVLKYHIVYFRNNINVMLRNSLFTVYGNSTFLRTNDFDIMNINNIKLYFYLFLLLLLLLLLLEHTKHQLTTVLLLKFKTFSIQFKKVQIAA